MLRIPTAAHRNEFWSSTGLNIQVNDENPIFESHTIRHSGSRFFALTATRIADDRLRIAVLDEGRAGIPHLQSAPTDAEDGRGMGIVDVLATRWGIIRQPGAGAAVWFECAP